MMHQLSREVTAFYGFTFRQCSRLPQRRSLSLSQTPIMNMNVVSIPHIATSTRASENQDSATSFL